MEVPVKLEPHKGVIYDDVLGAIESELDQWRVFATVGDAGKTVCVGYVGKAKGRAFCPLPNFVDLPEAYQQAIHAGVCREIGEQRPLGIAPMSVRELAAIEVMENGGDIVEDDEE